MAPLLAANLQTPPRVLDPAVGDGSLLEEAFHCILDAMPHLSPATVVADCLYGMDVDGDRVQACHRRLAALTLVDDAVLQDHVCMGDTLRSGWTHTTFDVILMNPPWMNLSVHPEAQPLRASHDEFPICAASNRRGLNTCHLFMEQAARVLRPGGRFLFVLPDSTLISAQGVFLHQICPACDICHTMFLSPERALFRLDCVVTIPARRLWVELTEQGAIGLVGTRGAVTETPTYFHSVWPVDDGSFHWHQATIQTALSMGHLCPDRIMMRVRSRFQTHYGAVSWARCQLGPAIRTPVSVRAEEGDDIPLQCGSVFHLRYLCDNFPCFPRRKDVMYVRRRDAMHCHRSRWLLRADREPVVVVPLFLDRDHRHRDQLRGCILPLGAVVDNSVSIHHVEGPCHLVYFLLGFWNSRLVGHLISAGFLAPGSRWLRFANFQQLPFPDGAVEPWNMVDTANILAEALRDPVCHPGRGVFGQMHPDLSRFREIAGTELCSMVSTLARDIQSRRHDLARNIMDMNICAQPMCARTKWKCWAAMTGTLRRPGQGVLWFEKHTLWSRCPGGMFHDACHGIEDRGGMSNGHT